MSSLRNVVAVSLTVFTLGCIPYLPMHPSLHPTASGAGNAAGVSLGASVFKPSDTDGVVLAVPLTEGIARFDFGQGAQLELRAGPSMGWISWRLNASADEGPSRVAFRPSLGVALWHTLGSQGDEEGALALAPNLAIMFFLGDGSTYLAPRVGYLHVEALGTGTDSQDNSGVVSLGGTIGHTLSNPDGGYAVSVELSVQRLSSEGDSTWLVHPSIGLLL